MRIRSGENFLFHTSFSHEKHESELYPNKSTLHTHRDKHVETRTSEEKAEKRGIEKGSDPARDVKAFFHGITYKTLIIANPKVNLSCPKGSPLKGHNDDIYIVLNSPHTKILPTAASPQLLLKNCNAMHKYYYVFSSKHGQNWVL